MDECGPPDLSNWAIPMNKSVWSNYPASTGVLLSVIYFCGSDSDIKPDTKTAKVI